MNLQTTIRRLSEKSDGEELRRAARDVGHELPRKRIQLLSQFRTSLDGVDLTGVDDFVVGYRSALADVVAAYEAAVAAEE